MDRAAYLLLDLLATRPRTASELASELHLDQSTVTRQVAAARSPATSFTGPRIPMVAAPPSSSSHARARRQLVAERTSRTGRISRTLRAWNDPDRAELARLLVLLNASIDDRLSTPVDGDT